MSGKVFRPSFRAGHLIAAARAHRVDGVVFLHLKFCDPHAFDYPYLKNALDREDIPNIMVEIEEKTQSAGQLQTRLEAFIERMTDR